MTNANTVEGEAKVIPLNKEFKRQKRLDRKERKKRKLEALKLEKSKLQPNSIWRYLGNIQIRNVVLNGLGLAMVLVAVVALARNAWIQTDNIFDFITVTGMSCIPEMAVGVVLGKAVNLWKEKQKLWCGFCFLLAGGLYVVVVNSADQYLTSVTTQSNMERITARKLELEQQFGVSDLNDRCKNAEQYETQVQTEASRICSNNDGTKCQTYRRTTIPTASKAKQEACTLYQTKKDGAQFQAQKELLSITEKNVGAVQYRKLLPLLGSILMMLGSV